MTRVRIAQQVSHFCASLPPEPRKKLRSAIQGLALENGDIKSLEGRLLGYSRLRCGAFRVIIKFTYSDGLRHADCIFAEHRSIVYEVLLSTLRDG
jgi:mRNA-degrading endonuclease RelE of RelBE toxin-antitoxin system